jgi:hypothetical protein
VQGEVGKAFDSIRKNFKKSGLNREWASQNKGWLEKYSGEVVRTAHKEEGLQFDGEVMRAANLQVCSKFYWWLNEAITHSTHALVHVGSSL